MRIPITPNRNRKFPLSVFTQTSVPIATFGLALLLSACDQSQSTSDQTISVQSERKVTDYVIYDGPTGEQQFSATYDAYCSSGTCIGELYPESAPIKKADGASLCAPPEHSRQVILTAYFSRDERFHGASCRISESDFDAVVRHLGRYDTFKKYLDQHVFEDFLTWRTTAGYVTTYKEIERRAPNGGVIYSYHVYTGPDEHPHYAEYVAD